MAWWPATLWEYWNWISGLGWISEVIVTSRPHLQGWRLGLGVRGRFIDQGRPWTRMRCVTGTQVPSVPLCSCPHLPWIWKIPVSGDFSEFLPIGEDLKDVFPLEVIDNSSSPSFSLSPTCPLTKHNILLSVWNPCGRISEVNRIWERSADPSWREGAPLEVLVFEGYYFKAKIV